MHEHRLPALRLRRAVEHLVGGHVGKQEAQDLRRIEVLGNLDRAGLRHADAVRVGAPHRQRADAIAHPQPRAVRAELLDDADELVAGRERRLRGAGEVRAGAQLGIGERHPRGQNPDEHLARTRSGNLLLDHLQDLGPAVVIDDDALHPFLRCRTHGSSFAATPSITEPPLADEASLHDRIARVIRGRTVRGQCFLRISALFRTRDERRGRVSLPARGSFERGHEHAPATSSYE